MPIPAGTIFAWGANAVPAGFLLCDGKSYKRNKFPDLFAVVGTIWGGDAADEFKVPDLRGRFLRGVDHGCGRDTAAGQRRGDDGRQIGDAVGSVQADQLQTHKHDDIGHTHGYLTPERASDDDQANDAHSVWSTDTSGMYATEPAAANLTGPTTIPTAGEVRHGDETRPKNAYVDFIIKTTKD